MTEHGKKYGYAILNAASVIKCGEHEARIFLVCVKLGEDDCLL
jgi:hypothetical protein